MIPHLLDSGCSIELASWNFVKRMNWKITKKQRPTILEYMDGRPSEECWYLTRQQMKMGPAGDRRIIEIDYLICNISEDAVLGLRWLKTINPVIDWDKETWTWNPNHEKWPKELVPVRAALEAFTAMKARQRIIQSGIQHNEPPEWVTREFLSIMGGRQPGDLPPHRPGYDYKVTMKDGWRPRREKQRRFSPEERRMFAELADQETMRHRTDPWGRHQGWRWRLSTSAQCSQMLWAAKAGGQKRPCHDYRGINSWMEDDQEPLPSIENMITQMSRFKYLTSIDLPKAYHEIRIAEGHITTTDGQKLTHAEVLAFQCGDSLYEPVVMQFGSKTAVPHFQRFIHHVLNKNWGKGLYAYLDNILMGADTIPELERLERDALTALKEQHLRIEPKKCEWHKQQVLFCGFLIGNNKIVLDPAKLDAIRQWTLPFDDEIPVGEKKSAVRAFHGFCNFYREAVPRYSDIAAPLTALMAPLTPWKVGEYERKAFEELKRQICETIEREAFHEEWEKHVHCDASQLGSISGGVAQKGPDGRLRPLGFFSKKLSLTEQRYTVTELELMAIVMTMRHFRHWLHACPHTIQVYSDHSALKNLLTMELNPRTARWIGDLGEFRLVIHHIPGRENRAADALSRAGSYGTHTSTTNFTHPEWFAPSGVEADGVLGMSHKELWRQYVEPLMERGKIGIEERTHLMEAWEKHKRMGSAATLKDLVSLLILSSNVR